MLIEFYGKLPHKPEFLISDNPSFCIQTFIDWISLGQSHIGESLLPHTTYGLCSYFFYIPKPLLPITIFGIFLNSQDNKKRKHPFIIINTEYQDLSKIKTEYLSLFEALQLDVSLLNKEITNIYLIDRYKNFLTKLPSTNKTLWQPINSQAFYESDKLNSILYRKLVTGEIK